MKATRTFGFWLGLLVGGVMLWLATRSVDFQALGVAMKRANVAWCAPFLLMLFGFYALKAVRWGVLVADVGRIPFRLLFRSVIIGYASNALLPAQLGDIVRALVASREMGLPAAPLLTTVVVERAFDLIVVASLLGVLLLLRPDVPESITAAGAVVLVGCVLSLAMLHVFGTRTEWVLRMVAVLLRRLSEKRRGRIVQLGRSAAAGASSLADWPAFLLSLSLTTLKWLLMAGCNLISLWAFGIDAPALAAVLVLAATVLAMILPSAPGYVGAIQFAYVFGLAPFGIEASDAVAASLFFHVLSYLSVVLPGAAYLHAGGYRLKDLRNDVERVP